MPLLQTIHPTRGKRGQQLPLPPNTHPPLTLLSPHTPPSIPRRQQPHTTEHKGNEKQEWDANTRPSAAYYPLDHISIHIPPESSHAIPSHDPIHTQETTILDKLHQPSTTLPTDPTLLYKIKTTPHQTLGHSFTG
jgi:hypothetical protein